MGSLPMEIHATGRGRLNMDEKKHSYGRDCLLTMLLLILATLIAYAFFAMSQMTTNIAIVYVMFIVLIARYTSGYIWGISASVIAVIAINFFFSEPIMELNFVKDGYPITFAGILGISLITGTTTAHLKEHQRLLLESEREKMRANLLRAISHDIRTPLTGIIGASQACLENPEMDKKEIVRMLEGIYEDSNWLLNMVENILSVTRIGSGSASVKTNPEPLDEILSDSVQRIKKRYPEARIHLELPAAIVMVSVDSIVIIQVIMNLLENAVKYSESSEPIILKAEVAGKKVRVSVRDFGTGIPADRMKNLFDGTYVCKDSRSDARRGMGIGLSLCKTIILAHGGEIKGINHNNGAEIYFLLPLEGEEHESENTDIDY